MNSHANAVKIGQQIARSLTEEIDGINQSAVVGETSQSNRRIGARGAAFRVLQNLWHDLYHVSVRARYDYVFEAYLKAIGWPE